MPARRLPWFKFWPEAMRHEKVVLLSDGAFRTWVGVLAAGSEQATRWRFASVRHLLSVTGRPESDVDELLAVRLLDLNGDTGEVWVHDWRHWQERYQSDFAPRTLRNGSAMAPTKLPGELRGESTDRRVQTGEATPGPSARGGVQASTNGTGVMPLSADDVALWATARAELVKDMLPANARRIEALEPLGRGADGGLRLRAPPGDGGMQRFLGAIRAHLVGAGDTAGKHAAIVTG